MNKSNILFALTILITLIFLSGCGNEAEEADLIIINGTVATVDSSNTITEAIAIKRDTILAVGSTGEIKNHQGDSTKVIDAKGGFIMPGFIDSHAHFHGLGKSKMILDLRDANNYDEVITMVARAAERALPGEWIVGRGWHQEKWDPVPERNVNGYPYHDQLSAATPMNPVYITHASGHALLANSRAMRLAGINGNTESPEGGNIVKDSTGTITGVFEENAENLILDIYNDYRSKLTDEELLQEKIRAYELAANECLSKGITTFHDAGSTFEEIDLLKKLIDERKIPVRLYVMITENNEALKAKVDEYIISGYGNNHLTVRAVKKYIDGALGSRGAWLLSPYEDDTTNYGLNVTPLDELRETANICIEKGLQMCTHAIGDRGNREILNIYESTFKEYSDSTNLRWRVEHAQHLSERDIPRFAELGVIASMQGVHCTSDAIFVKKRLGSYRAKTGAYTWRKLIDAGTTICNGTDAPVEDVNPIMSFYASVTRSVNDTTSFYPEQAMTREEALRSYTINGAYAAFEEDNKGSLEKGKLADIVILSNNLLECSDAEILNTKVLYTIVGGKIMFSSSN